MLKYWERMMHPAPAAKGFGGGVESPDARASILSKVTFWWLGPMLRVGWTRPLEEDGELVVQC